jgi:PHP family Zn ribbon phosphoesterase
MEKDKDNKPCTCEWGYYLNNASPANVKCKDCGGRQKVNRFGEGEKK